MSMFDDYYSKQRDENEKKRIASRKNVVSFKKLYPDARVPSRGSSHAAGFDLYAQESWTLMPGETRAIPVGVALALPVDYHGQIWGRSGNAVKLGLTTEAGIIDEDYRGELGAICGNRSPVSIRIEKGDRVAQLVIVPNFGFSLSGVHVCAEDEDLAPCGDRGVGGFGSTGR